MPTPASCRDCWHDHHEHRSEPADGTAAQLSVSVSKGHLSWGAGSISLALGGDGYKGLADLFGQEGPHG
jgi:hypothetical protein